MQQNVAVDVGQGVFSAPPTLPSEVQMVRPPAVDPLDGGAPVEHPAEGGTVLRQFPIDPGDGISIQPKDSTVVPVRGAAPLPAGTGELFRSIYVLIEERPVPMRYCWHP